MLGRSSAALSAFRSASQLPDGGVGRNEGLHAVSKQVFAVCNLMDGWNVWCYSVFV